MTAPSADFDRERMVRAISTELRGPQLPCLIGQITEAASMALDACAIASTTREMSYGELLSAAASLAEALVSAGVRPHDVVAIQGDKTCGTIVAMLAVLKADCVIVPLDPDTPLRRRLEMIHAAQASTIVLTHRSWEYSDEPYRQIEVCPDTGRFRAVARPEGPRIPGMEGAPSDLAYVMFTSGTTGAPRGILGSGDGISHFVRWQRAKFNIGPGDRISQLASFSFDASLREIFVALTSGSTLVLPSFRLHQMDELVEWIDACGVTIFHAVPSVGKAIISYSEYSRPSLASVRHVFFVGEPLTDHLVNCWRALFPDCGDIVNMYGTSETTLAKTFYEVPATPRPGIQPPGSPLPYTECYILDQELRICRENVDGDLYIRTPYRCLGLVNDRSDRPSFVTNPFTQDPYDVLHRTGDRGRYSEDGTLEITGRSDDEIKINGIRVNPQETQAILQNHPDLRACAVCAQKDAAGENRLTAFIVCSPDTEISQIRSWMANRVHQVFVPSRIVRVDSIPLTTNGKADTAKLIALSGTETPREPRVLPRAQVEPVTKAERVISRIICDLLGVDRVDLGLSFFEVGGHSLLAVYAVSRIFQELDVELNLRDFFEARSLQDIAVLVDEAHNSGLGKRLVGVNARGASIEGEQLPLSYPQERLWFMSLLDPETTAFVIPSAMRIHGRLDRSVFEMALRELVLRHDALRTRFERHSPMQTISDSGECDYEFRDLTQMEEADREASMAAVVDACFKRTFNIFNDRLLRVVLLRFSATEHVMVYSMHHIISDGWSLSVFKREFFRTYRTLVDDAAPALRPLDARYSDYVRWQRRLILEKEEEYAAYWLRQLRSSPERLALPLRRTSDANVAGRIEMPFTPEISTGIRRFSRATRTTVFVFLLAALRVLLYRTTGGVESLIGCPVAGRNRVEFERIIGFFINLLPLRRSIDPSDTFLDVLAAEKELFYEASMYQEYPYAKIVSSLRGGRRTDGDPLIQVLLNYQHYDPWTPELFEVEELTFETDRSAKYPIAFNIKGHRASGLAGIVEYDRSLLGEDWVQGFARDFVSGCEDCIRNSNAPVRTMASGGYLTRWEASRPDGPDRDEPGPDSLRRPPSPPRDMVETELARIVTEVLDVSELDMSAGLFDLGGDSLMAVRLTSRICSHFNVALTIRSFFESPTFRVTANEIKRLRREATQ